MERARRKRSAEDDGSKSKSRAKLDAELAGKHPKISHLDKIQSNQKESVKGPQRFRSVVAASSENNIASTPENVVTSLNTAMQPVSLTYLPTTIENASRGRGRGRPKNLPVTVSMQTVSPPGSVIISGTLGRGRPKTMRSEIHELSQVAPLSESDSNLEELDYTRIKLNRRYLTSWVPKLHRKKLIIEGNLIEIKDNATMISPNGRWQTTEIEEATSPYCIRTKKTEYCLEGPISLINCGKKMPSFIKDTFLGGFPPYWKDARDRWISYCEESETNDRLIEMSMAGSILGNSTTFHRYSDFTLPGITRNESFFNENAVNYRQSSGHRNPVNDASSVTKSPQSKAKLAQASAVEVDEDVLFKRPVAPRNSRSMKRARSFQTTLSNQETIEPLTTTNTQISDSGENEAVLRKDHEVEASPMKRRRGRPSKSDLLQEKNQQHCSLNGETEQLVENLDRNNSSPENIPATGLDNASPKRNPQGSTQVVKRNPKASEGEGLPKSKPQGKNKQGRPTQTKPTNGFLSPSSTKSKNKKVEEITKVNDNNDLDVLTYLGLAYGDVSPAPVEKRKRGRPLKDNLHPKKGALSGPSIHRTSDNFGFEDQPNDEMEDENGAPVEKKKRGRPSKKAQLLSNQRQSDIKKDKQAKRRQQYVVQDSNAEKRVSQNNFNPVMDSVHDEDPMNSNGEPADLPDFSSDAEENDSDTSWPFFRSSNQEKKSKKSSFPAPAVSQKSADKAPKKKLTPQNSSSEKAPKTRCKPKKSIKEPKMKKPSPKPNNQSSKTPTFNVNPKTIAERRQNAKFLQQRGANHQDDFFASKAKQIITEAPQTASDLNSLFPDSDVDYSVRSGSSTKTPINKYFNASVGETLTGKSSKSSDKSYTTDSGDNSYAHFAYEHRILKELPKRSKVIPATQIEPDYLPQPYSNSQEIAIRLLEIEERQKAAKELEENCMDSDNEAEIDVCNNTSTEVSVDDIQEPVPRGLLDLFKENTSS